MVVVVDYFNIIMVEEQEEFADPQFDVFQNEKIDVSTSGVWVSIIPPTEALDNDGDIRFQLDGEEKYWMQWGESKVVVEARILKSDGAGRWIDLAANDHVIFINNSAHSIFKDVKVKINQQNVEGGNNMYAWLAYMNNLLQFNQAAKGTSMISQGFHLPVKTQTLTNDDKGKPVKVAIKEWTDVDNSVNKALVTATRNKYLHFSFPLKVNIFQQGKSCPPGFKLEITLVRNSPEFCLVELDAATAGQQYKVVIRKCVLHMPMIHPHAQLQAQIANKRKHNSILYQFNHLSCFRQTVTSGVQSKVFHNIFQDNQPKLAVFALIPADVWLKTTARPFIFQKHGLTEITLRTQGQTISGESTDCDNDMEVYTKFNQALDIFNSNQDVGIDFDQFRQYSFLLTFDCTTGSNVQDVQEPSKRKYDVELKFSKPTTKNFDLLAFFIEDKRVILQSNNNVVPNDFVVADISPPDSKRPRH